MNISVEKEIRKTFKLELNPEEFLIIKTLLGYTSGTNKFAESCYNMFNCFNNICDATCLELSPINVSGIKDKNFEEQVIKCNIL